MNYAEDFQKLFMRDLDKLASEVNLYDDEEMLWTKKGDIKNSGGNLAMHICGNLQHFIGAVLLENGYERNRPFEFEGRMTREKIIEEIERTKVVINVLFESSKEDLIDREYPLQVFGYSMSLFYFLVHLHGHLNYHLGQINYQRRILAS